MKERLAFWKGVAAGIFGGIAIWVLARLAAEADRLPRSHATAEKHNLSGTARNRYGASSPPRLRLRRDEAESAGDPRITGPTTDAVGGRAFERPPGAPGGQTPAEVLEAPGRPGQYMDHATHRAKEREDFREP